MATVAADSNFTFSQALSAYNNDPVFTQTMWHIAPIGGPIPWQMLGNMQIYGQGFEVPARTNEFAEVQYRAYPIPTPTSPKMTQEHSITINADVKHELRHLFLDSMNMTLDVDSISEGDRPSFAADRRPTAGIGEQLLRLTLLASDYQTPTDVYLFHGVRVSEVGTMSLSNTDGGIASFPVSFRSVYFDYIPFDGAPLTTPLASP